MTAPRFTPVREYTLKYTFDDFDCEGRVEVGFEESLELHALYIAGAGDESVALFVIDKADEADEGYTVFYKDGQPHLMGSGNLLAGVLLYIRQKLKMSANRL